MNLFDRIMAQLEEEVPGGRGTLQAGLVKLCDYVDRLEARIERLEKNAADQEGYDADVASWREETDSQIAWRENEAADEAANAQFVNLQTGEPAGTASRTLPDISFSAKLAGPLLLNEAGVERLKQDLQDRIFALCGGENRIPYSDQGLRFVKEQTAKALREMNATEIEVYVASGQIETPAQKVDVHVDGRTFKNATVGALLPGYGFVQADGSLKHADVARQAIEDGRKMGERLARHAEDMPVLTKAGVHVNKAPTPKQVFACSRCNTPNEYQDGPFTCHGCKS
jgi:hypothetical protein